MIRIFVHDSLNYLSFIKTYPSGMEEKLSLKRINYTPKRFHRIHSQIRMDLTSTFISNTPFIGKRCLSYTATSSEIEPVIIYTNPDEHKGLIAKQNKGKSGIYRWVNKDSGKSYVGSSYICRVLGRPFSTLNKEIKNESSESLIPTVIYSDAFADKSIIFKDNNNKSGIYRWVNKVNGKSYVGSSENLTDRFRKYYSFGNIALELIKGKSLIYSAILKYGLKNFQVEILEYCAAENAISREQFYLYLLKPKYNILTTAGSRLGYVHSEEARVKMSNSAKGRKFSEETKKLFSIAKKGVNNPNFGKTHSKETRALITLAKSGKSVLSESMKSKMSVDRGTSLRVLDLITNETSVYPSITKAAEGLGVSQAAISKRFKNTNEGILIVKKRYKLEKVSP